MTLSALRYDCLGCGIACEKPNKGKKRKFCSYQCSLDYLRSNKVVKTKHYTCQQCGCGYEKPFGHEPTKYCGKDCYYKARKGTKLFKGEVKYTFNCEGCGVSVTAIKHGDRKRLFCTVECKTAKYSRDSMRDCTCEYCRTKFQRNKHSGAGFRFCSQDCSIANLRHPQ